MKLKMGKAKPADPEAQEEDKAKKPKKAKKTKESQPAADDAPPEDHLKRGLFGGSIGAMVLVNLGVACIAIAAVAVVQYMSNSVRHAQNLDEQVEIAAHGLAGQVSARMGAYADLLGALASSETAQAALAAGDPAEAEAAQQRLIEHLPNARALALLPRGWEPSSPDYGAGLSFAAMDLADRAIDSGEPSQAEVHISKEGQQYIALTAPVPGEDGAAGVLHASFPVAMIQDGFQDPLRLARMELQQMAGDKAITLVDNGLQGSGDPEGVASAPGTLFQVAYWEKGDGLDIAGLSLAAIAAGGALAAVILLALGQLKRMKGVLRQDQIALMDMVEEMLRGEGAAAPSAKMTEFEDLMGVIAHLRVKQRNGESAETPRKPAAPRPTKNAPAEKPAAAGQAGKPKAEAKPAAKSSKLPDAIFGAYDVRGIADQELTPEAVYKLGCAIGSEAYDQGQQNVIVARDGRNSSEQLLAALNRGLLDSGRDVTDIGLTPTPVLYFAANTLDSNTGVVVTGSHNPPEYNGLKIVINGASLTGPAIARLRERAESGDLLEGKGGREERDLNNDYIDRIASDVRLARPLKVAVDCGNGAASAVAPELFRRIGCEVIELFCEVDGNFPNHHPDPGRPENLKHLLKAVRENEADLGIALDGDGDRIGLVDSGGKIIWPDRLLMLLARDVLARQPGADVIYDVKSTRHLAAEVLAFGGRPIMAQTGHSLIKAKMRETGALLAGEMSGHLFIGERWYGFDDGMYAAVRLMEILATDPRSTAEVFAELPDSLNTPELHLATKPGDNFRLMQSFAAAAKFPEAKVIDIDGVRAEFEDGWGLARPSNTTPAVCFRFEADNQEAMERIQQTFRSQFEAVAPGLKLPF